jgi:hypothetical protein
VEIGEIAKDDFSPRKMQTFEYLIITCLSIVLIFSKFHLSVSIPYHATYIMTNCSTRTATYCRNLATLRDVTLRDMNTVGENKG